MQNRFFILLLILFSLCGTSVAQSGRKVKSAPAPEIEENREPDYSESAPNKQLPVFSSPNLRRKREIDSRKKAKQQNASAEARNNSSANTNAENIDDGEVLKIETNLITIPVSVYERSGLYIPGLRQSDFKIFEDGVEQEIAYFGTSDKPFTVILLIDTSPSTEYKIEEIQRAATAFVDQLKPADNVMVIEFDGNVHVLSEITNDRQRIYKAIQRADFGGGTSLYDAVDFSLRKRLNKIEGRKAIVLFTDGVDTSSYKADFESTIRDAEESEAMIFPIYYNTYLDNLGIGRGGVMSAPPTLGLPPLGSGGMRARGTSPEEYARGRSYLEYLATVTGGRVFRPESTPGGLTAAFEGIAEELRRQYNIGYYPQEAGRKGQRKQIKVRVQRPNVVVRSRDSYIVGGGSQGNTN